MATGRFITSDEVATVVARLVGWSQLSIDLVGQVVRIGSIELHPVDTITSDGTDGQIDVGELNLGNERPLELTARVRDWRQTLA